MAFKKTILNLPIRTANKELLPIFEEMMAEMKHMQTRTCCRVVSADILHIAF